MGENLQWLPGVVLNSSHLTLYLSRAGAFLPGLMHALWDKKAQSGRQMKRR